MSSSSNLKVRISEDGGTTWNNYIKEAAPVPAPAPPTPQPVPGATYVALVMHANWLQNSDFDTIASGNLNANDHIRYRCTRYPEQYDQTRIDYLKNNYRAKIPGLQIGIDIAFYDKIVANAAKIKSQGFDFVEYNLEGAFDGADGVQPAPTNLEQVRKASDAVHAQGMKFKVAPGKSNSSAFLRTGLLDDVAKLVDHYHIQCQSVQDVSPEEYSAFTESIARPLRAAKPDLIITSQVSPAQGNAPEKTLQQSMREAITAAVQKPAPGNTNGAGMWTMGDDVAEASSFWKWYKNSYT